MKRKRRKRDSPNACLRTGSSAIHVSSFLYLRACISNSANKRQRQIQYKIGIKGGDPLLISYLFLSRLLSALCKIHQTNNGFWGSDLIEDDEKKPILLSIFRIVFQAIYEASSSSLFGTKRGPKHCKSC